MKTKVAAVPASILDVEASKVDHDQIRCQNPIDILCKSFLQTIELILRLRHCFVLHVLILSLVAITALIIVISNLEPPATSSSNLFLIQWVGQLELREEGLPSKFDESHPFEQRVVLNKTSCIKNTKSYSIIISKQQMREFTLAGTICSVDDTKPSRLLPSHTSIKEICKDDL
jgi:hypothetical protein